MHWIDVDDHSLEAVALSESVVSTLEKLRHFGDRRIDKTIMGRAFAQAAQEIQVS